MTAQQPPRNSQANEAASARSCSDSRAATAACPLMNLKLQLVPLRYGIVEHLDPSSEVAMPYSLESRSIGVRLLRDGFLYIIEEQTGYIHEYEVTNGALSKLLWQGAEVSSNTRTNSVGPAKLVFPRQSTLYVAYSEVQWTAAKCSQVLDSAIDRDEFMQQINPGSANPATGGVHLMTWDQTERWLAEIAESHQETEAPELPEGADPDENLPYLWESPSLFKETSIDALKNEVLDDYKDDSLCLVIRDDIGVMRDLANFQDKVVTWIDDWAKGGEQPEANERDYMLACYIESLSQITAQGLSQVAELADQSDVQAMFEDLENLPEPEKSQTRQAISDYLNEEPQGIGRYNPSDDHPADLKALFNEIHDKATRTNSAVIIRELNETKEAYYAIQRHFEGIPSSDFVDKHRGALTNLKKEQNQRVAAILEGSQFGQRGINDLIDRPAMDAALERDRTNLTRWNALLDQITADRLEMTTSNRFHLAAWYYDSKKAEQIGLAFSAQYGCLKDICRSDNAIEAIHDWLEQQPDYDRPLFFTLPLNIQTQLTAELVILNGAAFNLVSKTSEWINQLREIESPYLPALDELPESTRVIGQSAHETFNPALAYGLSNMLNLELRAASAPQMPSIDELLARLPKATTRRMFDAARTEGVTFIVGSADDLTSLRQQISATLAIYDEQTRLHRRHDRAKENSGHKSPAAKNALADFHEARTQGDIAGDELFKRLSPISAIPESSTRLSGATTGHPGVTLVFPEAQQRVVVGMWRNLQLGYVKAPPSGMLGDGAGLLIAALQAVNLVQVWHETASQAADSKDWSDFRRALASTSTATFMAAQEIVNTALKARSAALIRNLQVHALEGVHVLMGKLHLGLGVIGYGTTLLTSLYNLANHQANWINAVNSGNRAAQEGASIAMAGSVGMVGTSTYGLGHTLNTGYSMLRGSSWAVSGVRLSTVFFRFNLAGALFTVAELGGTWWYNRQNLSRHDAWIQTTPWSRDAEKRRSLSLEAYQDHLESVLHAPVANLSHTRKGNWLSGKLGVYQGVEVDIQLPGVTREALLAPFGIPPRIRLSVAGHQIRKEGRRNSERWTPISEDLAPNTQMSRAEPLQLTISSQAFPESSARIDLVLVVRIEILDQEGRYQPQEHSIRLRTQNEGAYQTVEQRLSGAAAPRLALDPILLTQQDH